MSGRAKPGRGDEAEQLRELIRQAHEAAQNVRAAMREYGVLVQAARGEVITELQEYMRAQVDIGIATLTAVIEEKDERVIKRVQDVADQLDIWERDVRRRLQVMAIAEQATAGELSKSDAARELMRVRGDLPNLGSLLSGGPGS